MLIHVLTSTWNRAVDLHRKIWKRFAAGSLSSSKLDLIRVIMSKLSLLCLLAIIIIIIIASSILLGHINHRRRFRASWGKRESYEHLLSIRSGDYESRLAMKTPIRIYHFEDSTNAETGLSISFWLVWDIVFCNTPNIIVHEANSEMIINEWVQSIA